MRFLPDTNTLNYLLKGRQHVVSRFEKAASEDATFLLSSIAHFELTRYLDLKEAHKLLRDYQKITASWPHINLEFRDWGEAARLWAHRHRNGQGISDLDLLLAALARRAEAILVTSNVRHFQGLGVELEDWMSPI